MDCYRAGPSGVVEIVGTFGSSSKILLSMEIQG